MLMAAKQAAAAAAPHLQLVVLHVHRVLRLQQLHVHVAARVLADVEVQLQRVQLVGQLRHAGYVLRVGVQGGQGTSRRACMAPRPVPGDVHASQ